MADAGTAASQLDMASVEKGLAVLVEAYDNGLADLRFALPAVQIRALLIIERAGNMNLRQLAAELGASASAASRLCDRMEAADLLTRERAAASRREIDLVVTEVGRRLADWIRHQRCGVLDGVLQSMSPDGRRALARGLAELASGVQ